MFVDMGQVIRLELRHASFKIGIVQFHRREGFTNQVTDAVTHHLTVLLHGVLGHPMAFQDIIDSIAKVLDGVEKGTVKIENH